MLYKVVWSNKIVCKEHRMHSTGFCIKKSWFQCVDTLGDDEEIKTMVIDYYLNKSGF